MTKPGCLMVGPMSENVVAQLNALFTVHNFWEAEDKPAFLNEIAPTTRYVITPGSRGCSAEIINGLPGLELVASMGVGYDAVDVAAAKAANVRVTNTPDVLNDCVAEVTLGLMLSLAHRIPQADRYVREGHWENAKYPLADELFSRRAGILGLGRIGKEIARRLEAMRMEIVYHGRTRQDDQPYRFYDNLVTMAREVDWLVVIAPKSAATNNIVNADVMEALGPEGCLVNVARGSLVDQEAMIALLETGKLGGAALDVFAREPHVPQRLRDLENVVLLPHVGSATRATRRRMEDMTVANLRAHVNGEALVSPVA